MKREKDVLNEIWVAKTKCLQHIIILCVYIFLERHMGSSEHLNEWIMNGKCYQSSLKF